MRRLTAGLLALALLLGAPMGAAVLAPAQGPLGGTGNGAWAVLCGGGTMVFVPLGKAEGPGHEEREERACPFAAVSAGLDAPEPPALHRPTARGAAENAAVAAALPQERRTWRRQARAPPAGRPA
ncbi:MAG: hypothetical protein AAF371_04265 [Pseudomonadota bacterium]